MIEHLAVLPEGYKFAYNRGEVQDISATETAALRTVSGWPTIDTAAWAEYFRAAIVTVGVRAEDSALIGVGSLFGDLGAAELGNLVVDPSHRDRGIGRAIIEERVAVADYLGISHLSVELANLAMLGSVYASPQLNFTLNGSTAFRTRSN